jgi:hypothetical protein
MSIFIIINTLKIFKKIQSKWSIEIKTLNVVMHHNQSIFFLENSYV